jgi:hypothetical protein
MKWFLSKPSTKEHSFFVTAKIFYEFFFKTQFLRAQLFSNLITLPLDR